MALSTTRGRTSSEQNLDGTTTEYFEVEPRPSTLLAVLRGMFARHWRELVFGPCIQGAVFEGRFVAPPRLSTLDGYVTVSAGGGRAVALPPLHRAAPGHAQPSLATRAGRVAP